MAEGTPNTYMVMLEGLQRVVSEVDLAMGAAERLIEHEQDPANRIAAPVLFFVLLPALFDHLMLAAAKLYEQKGDRSIHKLIRMARSVPKEIPWKVKPFTVAELDAQQAIIDKNQVVLDRLWGRRDKVLAHMDKRYFDHPEEIDKDFPVTVGELISLLQTTQDVLSLHARAVGLGVHISFGDWIAEFTDRMVKTLRGNQGDGGG